MTYVIEGFSARFALAAPFIAVRRPVWQGDIDELRIHRLGVGSIAVVPTGGHAETSVLAGSATAVTTATAGRHEADWRVRLGQWSFALPPMMGVLGTDLASGLELRFAHIAARQGIRLPDGTSFPYGEDNMRLMPPLVMALPSEEALADELERAHSELSASGKRLLGVSTVAAREGAPAIARAVDIEVRKPDGAERRERSYIVALGPERVVQLTTSVDATGIDIALAHSDAIVASIRAEPASP